MQERDPEADAGVFEVIGPEGAAVVDIQPAREAAFLKRPDQTVAIAVYVFGQIEAGVCDEPGMVVDDGEEIAFAEFTVGDDAGAVHAIRLPEIVDQLGFKLAAILRQPGVLVQAVTLKKDGTGCLWRGCAPRQGIERGNGPA